MIRAVLDANVLVVAPLTNLTPPGQIVDAWQADRFELIISPHILSEVERAHRKPYFRARLTATQIDAYQRLLRRRATVIDITAEVVGVATHPEDDLVLATAVSAQADYLVTGDRPLRRAAPTYQGVRLLSPADFLVILDASA